VGRLTKHAKSAIASAAGELIKSWKATVTKEAAAKATADKPTVEVEVKEVEQEAAPAAAKVPTTPTATPSTGDAARDKLAVSLGEALAKVVEELGADVAGLADPSMVTSHRPSPLYVCLFVACGAHAAWSDTPSATKWISLVRRYVNRSAGVMCTGVVARCLFFCLCGSRGATKRG